MPEYSDRVLRSSLVDTPGETKFETALVLSRGILKT